MKRIAEDPKALARVRTHGLHRGYIAECANCGLQVVHAESTAMPFSMHRYSKLCRELGEKRRAAEK